MATVDSDIELGEKLERKLRVNSSFDMFLLNAEFVKPLKDKLV
jgi:hypothetical protein